MRNIAYRRVSTQENKHGQTTDRQLFGLDIEFDLEFEDYATGTSISKRPELLKCLAELVEGDLLHIHSIDRLARNTKELLEVVQDLVERGITVKFRKEHLSFGGDSTGITKAVDGMVLSTIGGIHTFQAVMIQESVKEGLRVAKSKGKLIGGSNPAWHETFNKNKLLGKHKQRTTSPEVVSRNENVVAEVKKIISYSSDTLNYSQIAEKLTEAGVTTAKGLHYSKASVCRLIKKFEIPYVQKNRKQGVTA